MSDTTLGGPAETAVAPGPPSPAAAEHGRAPARGDRVRHLLARMPPWTGAAVALAVTVVIVSVDAPAIFLTWDNISSILGGLAEPLILTAAMTLLLTFGIVDLSIAAMMTLGGIFMLGMINLGLPGWLVLPAAMGLVGLWVVVTVGFLIAVQRINYFIVTIGMLGVAGAFATIFTHGQAVSLFGKHQFAFLDKLGNGDVLGVPLGFVLAVAATLTCAGIVRYTTLGRAMLAVGGNREAARLAGIPVNRVMLLGFLIYGAMVGLAAVLVAGRIGAASPNAAGFDVTVSVIAGALIGGSAFTGGTVTFIGAFFGAAFFAVLANALSILDIPSEWQQVASGVVVVIAISLHQARERAIESGA